MWKIILLSAYCIASTPTESVKDPTMRKEMKHIEVAIPGFPADIDPVKVWSYYHYMIVQSLYSTLTRIDEEGKLAAYLADEWSLSDDKKVLTLHIRKGAKFSDGSKVTSKDVAFSLSRHAWQDSGSVIKGYMTETVQGMKGLQKNKIASGIDIESDKTLKIKLLKPYPPFLSLLAMPGFSIVKKNNPYIGAGPMVGEFDKELRKWILERNPHFFGEKTKLKSMSIRSIQGRSNIERSLSNKEIDIQLGIPVGEIKEIKLPEDSKLKKTETLSYNHFFYNTKNPIFSNTELRKDLGKFIQSIAWNERFLDDYQSKLNTILPKGVMPSEYYSHDEKSINAEDIKKKWKKTISNKKIRIIVVENHFYGEFLNTLKTNLESIGFSVDLVRSAANEYVNHLKTKDYDIVSGPYIGNYPDPDGFLEPLNEKSGIKFGVFQTSDLFKRIESVKFNEDALKRLKAYSNVLNDFENQWYVIPLYQINFPIIHRTSLDVPNSSYRYEAELWNVFWNQL